MKLIQCNYFYQIKLYLFLNFFFFRHRFLRACHKIVFTDEFEYIGYLVILMNMFPLIISCISVLNDIYETELAYANYYFLAFYIMEALLKVKLNVLLCVWWYV